MGEARRRRIAAAREAGLGVILPPTPPQRYRRRTLLVPVGLDNAIQGEYDTMPPGVATSLDHLYLVLIAGGLEYSHAARAEHARAEAQATDAEAEYASWGA